MGLNTMSTEDVPKSNASFRMCCSRADQPPWKAKMCALCSARSKELIALLWKVIRTQSLASRVSPMPGHALAGCRNPPGAE